MGVVFSRLSKREEAAGSVQAPPRASASGQPAQSVAAGDVGPSQSGNPPPTPVAPPSVVSHPTPSGVASEGLARMSCVVAAQPILLHTAECLLPEAV